MSSDPQARFRTLGQSLTDWAKRRTRILNGAQSAAARDQREGDAARDRRDWFTAGQFYKSCLRRRPDDFAIWVQLGHALAQAGLWPDAEQAYRKAAELRPADADLLLHRGHLARRLGDLDRARTFYEASFAIDGNEPARSEIAADGSIAITPGLAGAIDTFVDGVVTGWAVDRDFPGRTVEIEILVEDRVVGLARTTLSRKDVAAAGLGEGPSGFSADLADLVKSGDRVVVRTRRTGTALLGSPVEARLERPADLWSRRNEGLSSEELMIRRAACDRDAGTSLLTVVASLGPGSAADLRRLADSLLAQWCRRWELVLVADAQTANPLLKAAEKHAASDDRIRIIRLDATEASPPARLSKGYQAGRGTCLLALALGQRLEPEAVHRFLDAHAAGGDVVYCDEALAAADPEDVSFRLRPAYCPEYLASHPGYMGLFSVTMDVFHQVGSLDGALPLEASLFDFALRCIDAGQAVAHVPAVLYRSPKPTRVQASRSSEMEDLAEAVRRRLKRMGSPGVVAHDAEGRGLAVTYPDPGGSVLIVIPTKERTDLLRACLDSIWSTCPGADLEIVVIDHQSVEAESRAYLDLIADRVTVMPYEGAFNFARMNNIAVQRYAGTHPFVVFMNNDIEAITPGWLERMRSLAALADVGVVGVNLLYSDRTIQHSGVIVGLSGAADHGHRQAPYQRAGRRLAGPERALIATREYSAVTAACMMVRTSSFLAVGGFDEELAIGFNDTDLCLRIGSTGRRILNDGQFALFHHESATRAWSDTLDHPRDSSLFTARWGRMIASGDPCYNPLLSTRRAYRAGNLADMRHPPRLVAVKPSLEPIAKARPHRIAPPVPTGTTARSPSRPGRVRP
ncbi:hypothetical protein BH10PSE1_BH10PSE1_11120 [soil metagenome]